MKIIDTHAHLNFKAYEKDRDEVIKRALKNGIWMINVGVDFETSKKAVELAREYPQGIFAAVGFHPSSIKPGNVHRDALLGEPSNVHKDALLGEPSNVHKDALLGKDEEFSYEKYKELALNEKVVAIGEIGLDYYRIKDNDLKIKEKQKEIFIKQIELAAELKKPIIIHCRDAHSDVINILNAKSSILNSLPGVIHCFSGNREQAEKYRKLGFKIAFNGIITFSRDYDKVILDTPIEDILLETDCPYLAPVPFRSQRNEPLYVMEVAKKLAELKNLSFEEISEKTAENAIEVFELQNF